MLLAIDIGNSNIVIGGIDEEKIHFEARIATDRIKTSDQYGVEIKNMLDLFRVPVEEVEDCIISSVVPPVFNAVRTGVVKVTGMEPIVVGPGIKTGLNIQMDDPASVGSDRIVIAVAALQEYKPPIILVDMGTATTMEVVDHGNTYLGGCIIPGVRVSAEALSSRASQLPGIQLDKPKRVIGKNTVECMRSGIMYGAAAMLDGMLDRMEEELGKRTTVVVTGGMAQFIAPLCRRKMMVEKDLLLKGLYPHGFRPHSVRGSKCIGSVRIKDGCVENLGQRGGEAFAEWTLLGRVRAKCLIPSGKCGKKSLLS